eukprot:11666338-Heterocapsa_arctica.AAC.1
MYGEYLTNLIRDALKRGILNKDEHWLINRLNNEKKGDILEAVMGYAFIFNKTRKIMLGNCLEYMNIICLLYTSPSPRDA